jgi:hypothetical protein
MLADVEQLPTWLLVVLGAAIILFTAAAIWAWRHGWRIAEVNLFAGPVNAKLAPRAPRVDKDPSHTASVNINGNRFVGDTSVRVRRDATNVSDNLATGRTKIEVDGRPEAKPKAKRREQRK